VNSRTPFLQPNMLLISWLSDNTTTTQLGRLSFTVTENAAAAYMVVGGAAAAVGNAEKTHRKVGGGSWWWVEVWRRIDGLQRSMSDGWLKVLLRWRTITMKKVYTVFNKKNYRCSFTMEEIMMIKSGKLGIEFQNT
jgi:hypothetical protein